MKKITILMAMIALTSVIALSQTTTEETNLPLLSQESQRIFDDNKVKVLEMGRETYRNLKNAKSDDEREEITSTRIEQLNDFLSQFSDLNLRRALRSVYSIGLTYDATRSLYDEQTRPQARPSYGNGMPKNDGPVRVGSGSSYNNSDIVPCGENKYCRKID